MLVSWNWLCELADLDGISPADAARTLTFGGLQVEGIHEQARALENVVVGRILRRDPHPDADRLGVCQVDAGPHGVLTVVCGAPNARAGLLAPLALPGAEVAGRRIERTRMRGVDSEGMLCSAAELGVGGPSEGLLELDAGEEGTAFAASWGHDDVILDLSVTPNRGDALSMLGVARDLTALLGRALRPLVPTLPPTAGPDASRRVSVQIADATDCPRYAAALVDGVRIGPSPAWLRRRIEAIGQRSVNNVVDVTNWVLFELGQPLHAFDADRLRGARIEVRRGRPGESLRSLDGVERLLETDDVVIADAQVPVALAGVMGGADTEITNATSTVLIECANFSPARVRKTARRLGMRTESSYRFERGVDVEGVPRALSRAVELIARTQGSSCTMAPGVVDEWPGAGPRAVIHLAGDLATRVLGYPVGPEEAADALRRLGVDARREESRIVCVVPACRPDLTRDVDLVEEIGRLLGYDRIPAALPPGTPGLEPVRRGDAPVVQQRQPVVDERDLRAVDAARATLAAQGLHECVHWGFTDPELQRALIGGPTAFVTLRNPLGSETSVMRRTLLGGLLTACAYNLARGAGRVALFETGRVFPPGADGDASPEHDLLGVVLCGVADPGWTGGGRSFDLLDLTGLVARVGRAMGRPVSVVSAYGEATRPGAGTIFGGREEAAPFENPHARAAVVCGERRVGWVSTLHPDAGGRLEIEEPIHAMELDLTELLEEPARPHRFVRFPRTPGSGRDTAMLVPTAAPYASVAGALGSMRHELLGRVELFDVYTGPGVPEGYRSLALRFEYRDPRGTLTDAAVDAAHQRLVEELCATLGGRVR